MPMIAKSSRPSVPINTATKLLDADRSRRHLMIAPDANVWIGGSNITTANGCALRTTTGMQHISSPGCEAELWCVHTNGAATDVSLIEFSED